MEGIEIDRLELEDFMKLADEVFFKFPLRMPPKLVLPFRMINVLNGTCREIDEDFDFVKSSITFLEEEGYTTKVFIEQTRELLDGLWNRFRNFLLSYSQQQEVQVYNRRKENSILQYTPQLVLVATIILYIFTKNITLTLIMIILALSLMLNNNRK